MHSLNEYRSRKLQSGVTLIELLVVTVIVGILAAIAYPSYRAQVLRSHRTEGRAALMQTAQQLERCFTQKSSYETCATDGSVSLPYTSETGLYRISVDTDPALDVNIYGLVATPLAGQAADTDCSSIKIDQANRRTPANCW